MRQVGKRLLPMLTDELCPVSVAQSLSQSADHLTSLTRLACIDGGKARYQPKGVFRFKTHEEANRFDEECIAFSMALLARERKPHV